MCGERGSRSVTSALLDGLDGSEAIDPQPESTPDRRARRKNADQASEPSAVSAHPILPAIAGKSHLAYLGPSVIRAAPPVPVFQ